VQDLKLEIEAMKKRQTGEILEIGNPGKRKATTNASVINRIQEIEERISGIEDKIEEIDTSVKQNVKFKKYLTQNI
jgi:Tfp pilus assembly pilus retraction ATPase PilT